MAALWPLALLKRAFQNKNGKLNFKGTPAEATYKPAE